MVLLLGWLLALMLEWLTAFRWQGPMLLLPLSPMLFSLGVLLGTRWAVMYKNLNPFAVPCIPWSLSDSGLLGMVSCCFYRCTALLGPLFLLLLL
jgi:hypothetical protein